METPLGDTVAEVDVPDEEVVPDADEPEEEDVVATPASVTEAVEALGYTVIEGVDYIPGPEKMATVAVSVSTPDALIEVADCETFQKGTHVCTADWWIKLG